MVMLYNPLDSAIRRRIELPLYYTGLDKAAAIRVEDGPATTYTLDRLFKAAVDVTIPAGGHTWLVVTGGD